MYSHFSRMRKGFTARLAGSFEEDRTLWEAWLFVENELGAAEKERPNEKPLEVLNKILKGLNECSGKDDILRDAVLKKISEEEWEEEE